MSKELTGTEKKKKKKKKKYIYIYLYAGIVNCQDKNNPEHSECWREEQVLIQAT